MTRNRPIHELEHRGLTLYRFYDSGQIKWCRIDPGYLAAKRMDETDPDNVVSIEEMNRRLLNASNDFLGTLAGKTVLIFGTGPQLKRFTKPILNHLSRRKDLFLIGINAAPAIARKIWGIDPSEFFDLLIASDVVTPEFFAKWGWDLCPNIKRFCFWRHFDGLNHPILRPRELNPAPTGNAWTVYGHTSIVAAIGISLAGLATASNRRGQVHFVSAARGGKIILVGIEENRWDHAYSAHPDFDLQDNPSKPWAKTPIKTEEHEITARWASRLGALVLNSAPWSSIKAYPFTNFEDALNLPKELHVGISLNQTGAAI